MEQLAQLQYPLFYNPVALDVYAFGVILWELVTGKVPWKDLLVADVERVIQEEQIDRVGSSRKRQKLLILNENDDAFVEFEEDCADTSIEKKFTTCEETRVNHNKRKQAFSEHLEPIPQCVSDLVKQCLASLVDKRPSFDEICTLLREQMLEIISSGSDNDDGYPACFLCPLTFKKMIVPVLAADGQSYERAAIVVWLKQTNRSPVTNEEMTHRQLTPNFALRSAMAQRTFEVSLLLFKCKQYM